MFRRPSLGLAEIAWRWSFDAAAAILIWFSCFEYLDTLPVSAADRLLLKTRHPLLVSRAMANIFRGSSVRMMEAAVLLALLLAVGWITVGALGRATTVNALLAHFRDATEESHGRIAPLFGLNFFRATSALAAGVCLLGGFLLAYLVSPRNESAPGIVFLVVFGTGVVVWLAWSIVNWFLSLASVFVVAAGEDTFGSMLAAADLCRRRAASVFAAGTWFGLAHFAAFVLATTIVAVPVGMIGVVRVRVVLLGVLLVTMLYLAIVDFLYIGRLAAYVAILEWPEAPASPEIVLPPAPPIIEARSEGEVSGAVDPAELILSDLPEAGS